MKRRSRGTLAWVWRATLGGCGLAAIILSETSSIGTFFRHSREQTQLLFRCLGASGLVLAVVLEYCAAWKLRRKTATEPVRRERRRLATIHHIQRSADYHAARIRTCRNREDVETHLAAFMEEVFWPTCGQLFAIDVLASLFLPAPSGVRRLTLAYIYPDVREVDPTFEIELEMGDIPWPVGRKGVAGFAFATCTTHYIEMDDLRRYEVITAAAPGAPLLRSSHEESIWKPSSLAAGYEALLCIPLCERLTARRDAQTTFRPLGVLCLEIGSKAKFGDVDVLAAWIASGALTRVFAAAREAVQTVGGSADGPKKKSDDQLSR